MSQIEVPKIVQYNAIGAPADNIAVSRLVMYAILVPGDDGGGGNDRQAHVYAQKIRRD